MLGDDRVSLLADGVVPLHLLPRAPAVKALTRKPGVAAAEERQAGKAGNSRALPCK